MATSADEAFVDGMMGSEAAVVIPSRAEPAAAFAPSIAWNGPQRIFKRVLDVLLSAVLLLLLAPIMLLIALLVRLDSAGPAIFRQTRVGKHGREFTFLKFRGMVTDAEARKAALEPFNEAEGPIFKMRNDPRVTRMGRLLRRTSLDELPQLWNVLRGEMSLVGPRPPLPAEVQRYQPWQRNRLLATPGITGLWQVMGRSQLSFTEMVSLDLEYIAHWSLRLELAILARTLLAVLFARGAY